MRESFEEKSKQGRGRPLKHRVVLSRAERKRLVSMAKNPANENLGWRSRLLLSLDEGDFSTCERGTSEEIAELVGVSTATVFKTAKRFANNGLDATLDAPITGPRFSAVEEESLKNLVNSYNQQGINWSLNGLAKELGRSRSAVTRATKRLAERGELNLPDNSLT